MISVTTVVENVFCEKFTYYSEVLGIRQYEEKRGTVMAGRTLHQRHEKTNRGFVPGDMRGRKMIAVKFRSAKHNLVGIIDEAIETDEEIILFERKFSNRVEIDDKIRVQVGLLAILIEENVKKPVKTARVVFHKDGRTEIEVPLSKSIRDLAMDALCRTARIIETGIMPESHFNNRCLNCCYRKICPVGYLNTD